jgi:hypothetical protein
MSSIEDKDVSSSEHDSFEEDNYEKDSFVVSDAEDEISETSS